MDGACADGECQAAPIGHSPTTVGWGGCATQKPLSGFANGRGADRVADADEAASRDALSPIDSAKAVQIKRIGKVFDINPDPITTGDVLNKKSAFAAVVDGFLLDHEAALGLATHGKYELWGRGCGSCFVPKSSSGRPFAATAALEPTTDTPALGRRSTHEEPVLWCQRRRDGMV